MDIYSNAALYNALHKNYNADNNFIVSIAKNTGGPVLELAAGTGRLAGGILDLGFGDGRNFSLFLEQGLEVFGVEISEKIVEMARLRFRAILNKENLKVGFNGALPFPDQHFDYIVACHSLYYMERSGSTIGVKRLPMGLNPRKG